jgi:hypothetical protein
VCRHGRVEPETQGNAIHPHLKDRGRFAHDAGEPPTVHAQAVQCC